MNPLLEDWTTPFCLPPFDRIKEAHFKPAFDQAIADWQAEIEAVATDPAAPDFANTIEAMERSGHALDKVASVFFNLCSSDTTDGLQAIEEEIAPVLAKTHSEIYMDERLFARVDVLVQKRESLGLTPEQDRVLGLYHDSFVRAGAQLSGADRERMTAIMQRLATLGTQFSKNLLADEKDFELVLGADDLAGLPDTLIAAAARAAKDRGHAAKVDHHRVALRCRAVPAIFRAPRSARTAWRWFVGRGGEMAPKPRRQGSLPKPWPAGRAGQAARLRQFRRLQARQPDGQAPRSGARSADAGLGRRRKRRRTRPREAARDLLRRRAVTSPSRHGTGALCREAAPARARSRRGGDQTLHAARPDDRGCLRYRVRLFGLSFPGARRAASSPGCARLGSHRTRRRPYRRLHGRLFRPALEALAARG